MKIFINPFRKKKNQENDISYLGGDGLTEETPVGINCKSMHRAEYLIERFINEKHGQKMIDWEMGGSLIFPSSKVKCGYVMNTIVKTKNGEKHYYFDLSRPILLGNKSIEDKKE